jgi:hypothetical protein
MKKFDTMYIQDEKRGKNMTNQVTQKHVDAYIDHIMNDYQEWCDRAEIKGTQRDETHWVAEEGRNYIKIIHCRGEEGQKSVHSFIVKKATKKFVEGDVLMAASWKAPATNFARATVFDTNSFANRIRWAGIS